LLYYNQKTIIMRNKIVAGNWKMNKTFREAGELIEEIIVKIAAKPVIAEQKDISIILAPPFICLQKCAEMLEGMDNMYVAAQNCHSEEKGAFTGEISVAMLQSVGVDFVIIGHSERRSYFHEDHAFLAAKVATALINDLCPIFCIGEVLAERESGQHFEVIKKQLDESLFSLTPEDFSKIILAYEPVWAIGTGLTATPEQAQEMHNFIRKTIAEHYGTEIAAELSILYGGSCNAQNARELFSMPDVDGGLIGGASLKADDFITIIESIF
jgi:triosephosphate isomerase (TIM)